MPLWDSVANYEELWSHFRETKWSRFFDEA